MRTIYLLLLLIVLQCDIGAQQLEGLYNKALSYRLTEGIDSSILLLNKLIEALDEQEASNSPLVLSARLRLIERKARIGRTPVANMEALHQLIEQATMQKEWGIVAEAYLVLGWIHADSDQSSDAKQYLRRANSLINKHQLQHLYAKYLIRRAANFRQFTSYGDSVLHYASSALDYAVEEDEETKAEAYYLIGHMRGKSSITEGNDYLRKALRYYQRIGDDDKEVHMNLKIAHNFYRLNQLDSALIYNDRAKRDFNKITLANLARVFLNKAQIYKQQGQMDSAWHFYTLSYEAQLEKLEKENRKAIADVEEKYQTEKKIQQIEEQKLAIWDEKSQKNRAIAIAAALLLLVALITNFYLRLRRANKINRQQAERLKNLDASKSRFFANVSHELRTPLTLMLGPVNALLKENHLSDQQVQLLQTASQSGQQLQQLINEILDLRKLELGQLALNWKATALHAFFLRYLSQFDSLAESKAMDYVYQIEIPESAVGQLDQEKCRQLLYNLLSNAFKFTPQGGQIRVNIQLKQQQLFLSVSDTGKGIYPEDMAFIFNRYFQTNRPEKPIEGGTGIGLALCKEYVELFGGKISVENRMEGGSIFQLFFPLTLVEDQHWAVVNKIGNKDWTGQAPPLPTVGNGLQKAKRGKASILVVEDNPDLSDYLALLLSERYHVDTAADGQQALELLFKDTDDKTGPIHKYQLVLSDLMMPIMDGYQLLESLKKHDATRHIPVVMLTARAELRDKLKALRIGVDDYLIKPFEEEELLVRIENLLMHQANRKKVTLPDVEQVQTKSIVSGEDQEWLASFEYFVQNNIADSFLSVSTLADKFSMSEATLFRQMKRITGLSPAQYLKEVRLEKALRILENHQYNSIAKVAYEVGYSDPNSFTRAFKRRFGKPPSKFINIS
ncbi:MAG: ATP-binding protein [Bacteroidota bacterium]